MTWKKAKPDSPGWVRKWVNSKGVIVTVEKGMPLYDEKGSYQMSVYGPEYESGRLTSLRKAVAEAKRYMKEHP